MPAVPSQTVHTYVEAYTALDQTRIILLADLSKKTARLAQT